ncbi:disulfide bond formation protein B [Muricoccus aerilatus]|uniref:disulfide bond formation protein B n=1 Tax=Muricoccus aerilatus TaxID=452982 RepID=UPI001FE00BF4|nr:disulfide bond formation protein B [Roseomonas aerilata]
MSAEMNTGQMSTGPTTRQHAVAVALLAAAAPLAALASERFLEMAPCALCLWQRWPYWLAVVLAALAAGMRSRPLLALAGLAVLVSGAIAALHVGVEQGWWPSPLPSCAAPTAGATMSVDDLMRSLAARPAKPCDAAAYLIPGLPVSMAAMNLLYALALGALALTWSRRGAQR